MSYSLGGRTCQIKVLAGRRSLSENPRGGSFLDSGVSQQSLVFGGLYIHHSKCLGGTVLVCYCSVTNYHKLSTSSNPDASSCSSTWQRSSPGLKAEIKVWSTLCSFWRPKEGICSLAFPISQRSPTWLKAPFFQLQSQESGAEPVSR